MVRPRIHGQASAQSICQRGPPRNSRRHLLGRPRLQRADARRGEIARNAAHGKAIAAVRCHADIDHRVVEPGPVRVGHADRRIVRKIDYTGMVLAQSHFACGEQHPRAAHAADFSDFQRGAGAWDEAAGCGEHALHAGPRIRCAADHEHRVIAGVHLAHAQPVGVGVLHRLDDARDAECRQRRAAILHVFEFQADAGQRGGDQVKRGVGIEVGLQPRERRTSSAHIPSCSMVGARGEKP